jgi:hypothetical protein
MRGGLLLLVGVGLLLTSGAAHAQQAEAERHIRGIFGSPKVARFVDYESASRLDSKTRSFFGQRVNESLYFVRVRAKSPIAMRVDPGIEGFSTLVIQRCPPAEYCAKAGEQLGVRLRLSLEQYEEGWRVGAGPSVIVPQD